MTSGLLAVTKSPDGTFYLQDAMSYFFCLWYTIRKYDIQLFNMVHIKGGYNSMTITIEGKTYLTAKEAADYLGVSAATFLKFQEQYNLKWLTRPGMGQRKFFA